MRVAVVTLFPAMFEALTGHGISGRAFEQGLLALDTINPRDFAGNRHGRVDDRPYGGGPGMVMSVPPLRSAITVARQRLGYTQGGDQADKPLAIYLSPQGEPLTQQRVAALAELESMVLLCGRYEGVDERVVERDIDLELSLGDYVISGGELAAMVLIDAMVRLQPGALGDEDSAGQDSFAGRGLLDCPHYTRPEQVDGQGVPGVLLGGDHGAIADWRMRQSLQRTLQRRPELLESLEPALGAREREVLAEVKAVTGQGAGKAAKKQ